jgi:hypothetical protein
MNIRSWPVAAILGCRVKHQVKRAAQVELARPVDELPGNGREFGQLIEIGLHA